MTALGDRVYHALLWVVGTLLGVLTVVVSYQVFGRYVPFVPRALWTEEIARLSLEWLVFLGAALALRRNEHFVIDLIPGRFDERFRKPIQLVILAFVAVGAVVLILGGLAFAETGAGRTSTTSGISLVWAFSAIPVSGLIMLFFVVELAVRTLKGESVAELGQQLVDESAVHSSRPGVEGMGE
jgi:TRAP-type transport system small permease protein